MRTRFQKQVRCSIVLDDSLLIREANLIARKVRQKIEKELVDVSVADIHLELEDNCWGQCGESLGPTCALASKMNKSNTHYKGSVISPAGARALEVHEASVPRTKAAI